MAVQIGWKWFRLDLISLEFSINRPLFQNQVHHGGRFLMIQPGLRRAVAASAAQAGDDDWIINSIPLGIELQASKAALVQGRISLLKASKAFYLSR